MDAPTQPPAPDCGLIISAPKIDEVSKTNPLVSLPRKLRHKSASVMCFSSKGHQLATASSEGMIKIWNTESWLCSEEFWDKKTTNLDIFTSVQFIDNDSKVMVAGRSKKPNSWELGPSLIKVKNQSKVGLI